MLLPVVTTPDPVSAGWPALRAALWRASRVKLLLLFVMVCWSVGLAVGGTQGPRQDAGDLAVIPGHPPAGVRYAAPDCTPRPLLHPACR